MAGLSLNYGDAWGLDSTSRNCQQTIDKFLGSLKEKVKNDAMSKTGCDSDLFEDCWDEVWKTTNEQLPVVLRVAKRNEYFRNKIISSLKKEIGDDEVFNNKSYTAAMFDEKDIAACEKIGVTPQQMVDYLKSLY